MTKDTKRGVPEGYLGRWSERHAAAEAGSREISSLAFPGVDEHPGAIETFAGEDMGAIAMSGMAGMQHLSRERVLQKWEVPDLPPSHHEGFGSSTAHNYPPSAKQAAAGQSSSSKSLELETTKLAHGMGDDEPLERIVSNRKATLMAALESGDPDASWYQGKAQALIHHVATQTGVPDPVARKVTAAESPRMKWDNTYVDSPGNRKLGRAGETVYPNVEAAGRIIDAAKGRNVEEAQAEVAARGIPGVQRGVAARVASEMMTGTMRGHDPIPIAGEGEKIQSFEVNLSDPTHPEYGYSPWVHRHQLSAHTPDVQDARAGGFHEEQLEVPRPTHPETGKPMGKPRHEEMLQKPAGADIAQSTALVARSEVFHEQRAKHGEEWARQNAINFMPGPSQSMQWSVARRDPKGKAPGVVDVPEHMLSAYAQRPQGGRLITRRTTGGMTTEDWEQM